MSKCPNCNADMKEIDGQIFLCPKCGGKFRKKQPTPQPPSTVGASIAPQSSSTVATATTSQVSQTEYSKKPDKESVSATKQQSVANKKKMSKGKIAGIILATIATIGVLVGGAAGITKYLQGKNIGDKPGQSQPITPDKPVNPDKPVDPPVEPDKPVPPPVVVEKTEAEYKVECEKKINEMLPKVLQYNHEYGKVTNVQNVRINAATGTVYCNADFSLGGDTEIRFFTTDFSKALLNNSSYKGMDSSVDNLKIEEIGYNRQLCMSEKVSETKLDELKNYVLTKAGLDGAEVLNVSRFSFDKDGRDVTTFTVLENNRVSTIEAKTSAGTVGSQEGKIDYMLAPEQDTYNKINIVKQEEYKDFLM